MPIPEVAFSPREVRLEYERDLNTIENFINEVDEKDPAILLAQASITESPPTNREEFNPRQGKVNVQTWITFVVSRPLGQIGFKELQRKLNEIGYTVSSRKRSLDYAGHPEARQYYINVKPEKAKERRKKYPRRVGKYPEKPQTARKWAKWIEGIKNLGLLDANGDFIESKYKKLVLNTIKEIKSLQDAMTFSGGHQQRTKEIFQDLKDTMHEEMGKYAKAKTTGHLEETIYRREGYQYLLYDSSIIYDTFIEEMKNTVNDNEHFSNSITTFKGHLKPFKQAFVESIIDIALKSVLEDRLDDIINSAKNEDSWKEEAMTQIESRISSQQKYINRNRKPRRTRQPRQRHIQEIEPVLPLSRSKRRSKTGRRGKRGKKYLTPAQRHNALQARRRREGLPGENKKASVWFDKIRGIQ